jgi:hypothetical protein
MTIRCSKRCPYQRSAGFNVGLLSGRLSADSERRLGRQAVRGQNQNPKEPRPGVCARGDPPAYRRMEATGQAAVGRCPDVPQRCQYSTVSAQLFSATHLPLLLRVWASILVWSRSKSCGVLRHLEPTPRKHEGRAVVCGMPALKPRETSTCSRLRRAVNCTQLHTTFLGLPRKLLKRW